MRQFKALSVMGYEQEGGLSLVATTARRRAKQCYERVAIYYGTKKIAWLECIDHGVPSEYKYQLLRAAYTTSRNEAQNEQFVWELKQELDLKGV